jgi:hypothetical protein
VDENAEWQVNYKIAVNSSLQKIKVTDFKSAKVSNITAHGINS